MEVELRDKVQGSKSPVVSNKATGNVSNQTTSTWCLIFKAAFCRQSPPAQHCLNLLFSRNQRLANSSSVDRQPAIALAWRTEDLQ